MNPESIERAFTTEGAIAVLKSILLRPSSRANGKYIMTETIDAALCKAIIALEKELKAERNASCDHLNGNAIWVSHDVYERIKNNPKGVVFEAQCEAPIFWKGAVKGEKR